MAETKKKKNSNLLVYFLIILLAGTISGVLSGFNVFQKLDYRIYDFFIQYKKDPEKNDKIIVIQIDDPSIDKFGEWPWSRDVIADVLIRLKEFNAYNAIFDIEYLDSSKMGVAPSATEKISEGVVSVEYSISDNFNELRKAINSGYFKIEDIPDLMDQLQNDIITPQIDNLNDYIINESFRDNDEYFGKAIQFFGNTNLTVNLMSFLFENKDDDATRELKYYNKYSKDQIDYIHKRFLISDVQDPNSQISLENKENKKINNYDSDEYYTPTIYKLLNRANGIGFTNSYIDDDGIRRRMETLYKWGDDYVAQLALSPYLKIIGSNDIVKQRRSIVIRNAIVDGVKKDIKIPTDNHGAIIVNYPQGDLDETFTGESIINIILLDECEENIFKAIKNFYNLDLSDTDGYQMECTIHAANLWNDYLDITDYKRYLLSKCTGYDSDGNPYDGIAPEEYADYYEMRNRFFENVAEFLNSNYMDTINEQFDKLLLIYDEDQINSERENIQSIYDDIKREYDFYNKNFGDLKKKFENAYCFIGNTAIATTDLGATPFIRKYANVGIHANVLNTLLLENYIYYIDWYFGFAVAVVLALLLLLFMNRSNTFLNAFGGIFLVIMLIIPFIMFTKIQYYIPCFGIYLFVILNYIGGVIYRFLESSKEKRFITQVAASFANKDTVEQLRKNPELFKTEGIKKYITALFTDIQKFSTFSESITKIYGEEGANKLILHLNDYLGAMSNEILLNGGNIDKYEGDAIISMFGAPDATNLHNKEEWAYLTLDSAIRMKKIEQEFNDSHKDLFRTYEVKKEDGTVENITLNPFKTRIGINSGDAFVGLMGSQTPTFNKLNYTMIGDTVNLAARLEGVNKAYASWILCSDSTWNLANSGANEGKITAKRLDQVRVVGRSTPVQLYNIVGFTEELTTVQKEEIEIFHAALDRYLKREFVAAGKMFVQASNMIGEDPTALIFANRCKDFIENGVPENWDGVINMTSK